MCEPKSNEARPVFHFTERRIESHISICFVAYKLYKELERILRLLNIGLSVDKALDIAKNISTVSIRLNDGTIYTRTLLNTAEERLLMPLLPGDNRFG